MAGTEIFSSMQRILTSLFKSATAKQYACRAGILLLTLGSAFPVIAQKRIMLQKFETPDVRLVFLDKNTSYLVPHAVRSFENSLRDIREFWNYVPSGKTNILFNDFTDVGNGGTMVLPWNFLNIAVSPFDYTFSVVPSNERMQWLMSHELTHQTMCDNSSKSDHIINAVFGGRVLPDNRDPLSMIYSYFTAPRWYSPRWYQEGIAVFMETWMSGGVGRVMGGYDEMVFRTMVHDSAYFYNVIGLETEGTTIDFQVGVNAYLYGTRFISYLAYTYGIPRLKEFYTRTDSTRRFYAAQFKDVYGIPVDKEWDKWIAWEHDFQKRNLETIREYPVSGFRQVTPGTLGSVSRQFYDPQTKKIIAAVNYPGRLASIVRIDAATGRINPIAPVPSPGLYYVTSLARDDSTKTIYASTNNKDWRGLQSISEKTGKIRNLVKITRCGSLVFDRKGRALWGIQTLNGRTSLIRFPEPCTSYQIILTLPYGQEIFDPDISPDGEILSATLSEVTGRQQLVLYRIRDLMAGKSGYRVLHEFEDNPASNFVFSPDGKYLYGTSYYTGVSNVFRIPVAEGTPQILTNAVTGFFRPLPLSTDSMLVFSYTAEGMVAGMMKIDTLSDVNAITFLGQEIYRKDPGVESLTLPPPSVIRLDSIPIVEKRYRPVREIKLATAYPIIQGYKNFLAVGYRLNFMDPMFLNSLNIKLSVTPYGNLPRNQIPHVSAEYNYWNWSFTGNYNYADFYDLFGPTRFSRAGYSFSARYYKLINRFAPRKTDLYVKASVYGGLETLPQYQNIASDYRNIYVGTFNFHKSYLRRSLGAIELEQGYDWNFYAYASLAKQTFYPQIVNNFDTGFLLPVRNTTIWLRTSVGQSFGQAGKTNSYFYFGGFGNNYLDYRSAQQYRDMASFPGMEIDAIPALNYGKASLELNLKPLRFKKLGFNGFYSTYVRATFFGMGLFTNMYNSEVQRNYYASGVQLDMEVVLFTLLKSTLSFGYSRAFDQTEMKNQFMVSLKL